MKGSFIMKKLAEEATIENVLESIKENKFNRTQDIIDFIMALEQIEENMFISIDAKWGAGKTFYVRQIEQSLNYLTRKAKELNIEENVKTAFSKNPLGSLELEHTYFPVYYNAWLYDNHSDPLMSLILSTTKVCECYCDEKLNSNTLSDKIISLMDSFSFSLGCVQFGSNFGNAKEKFSGKDILSSVKTEEEIRDKVKEIFDSIIVENVQKLVIFIDELDRCRPNFAIEMLERMKHYFDDDRIIFVASINREQLIHSISKYYGTNFDSTGYLDKFFDWNIYLPELDTSFGNRLNFTDEQYFIENITKELSLYFQLTYREKLRYNQCISFAILSKYVSDHSGEKIVLSAFVSIITILNIKDETKKMRFLQGDSGVLDELFKSIPTLHRMACKFGKLDGQESEENFEIGYAKIKEVFDYVFGIGEKRWYKGVIEISDNFKEICLRICSGLRISKSSV
jgi:hypothetical protein